MTPDKQAAPSEWVERAMKLSRVCAVKSLNKDVRSFYAANEALRAHLESREEELRISRQSEREAWRYKDELEGDLTASQALVKQLAEALERVCAHSARRSSFQIDADWDNARAALAAYQEKT